MTTTRSGPSVSIIIATYNRAALLLEALESVRTQTLQDYEVLVADDGSTDDTEARLLTWTKPAGLSERLHYLPLPHSAMPEKARNAALTIARGTFVAFLDDDDRWEPSFLARMVGALDRSPAAGLAYSDLRFQHIDGTITPPRLLPKHRNGARFLDALLDGWAIYPSMMVFRRVLQAQIGRIDEDLSSQGDFAFLLRLANAGPAVCVPEPLVIIRRDPAGLSVQRVRLHYQNTIRVYERFLSAASLGFGRRLRARRTLARLNTHVGLALLADGEHGPARRRFVRSLRWFPLQRRAWTSLASAIIRV